MQKLINLSLSLIFFIISFFVLEILVRVFIDPSYWRFKQASDNWILDKDLGWSQKKNIDYTKFIQDEMIEYTTNDDGVQTFGEPTSKLKILIVGDSTAAGVSVQSDKRIHSYLVKHIFNYSQKKAYVINASVEGYSTDQSLIQLKKLISKYKPQFVLHIICENDFLQNQSNSAYNIGKPKFKLINDQLVLVPHDHQNNSISTTHKSFQLYIQYSAIYRLLRPHIESFRIKFGIIKTVESANIDVNSRYENIDWNLFKALILEMDNVTKFHNAHFILYKHPSLEEVWPQYRKAMDISNSEALELENIILSISKNIGITYLPMIPYFTENIKLGPFHLLPRNPHANEKGYDLQAKVISKYILSNIYKKDTNRTHSEKN